MKKNKYFNKALNQAADISVRKHRMIRLVSQLAQRLQHINWNSLNQNALKTKFTILGRLSKAYAMGHYKEIPWKAILAIVAAIVYFLNPIDLLPDFIPVLGLTDDFGVLVWVYSSLSKEIDKFLEWERTHITVS